MVGSCYPKTLEEALAAKAERPSLVPYAGGTDWMVNRRDGTPLLFLNYIPSLREITKTQDSIKIGACCTYTQLLESDATPDILRQAIVEVASPAIRNMGTLGGNICNASPAGDTLPVLYILDARVVLASVNGKRELPISSFIRGVRSIDLNPDELLESIIIPKAEFTRTYYKKVGARRALAISKASFAAAMRVENGVVTAMPVAFGSVAPTVVRRPEIESALIGKTPAQIRDMKDNIADMYEPHITPIDDQRSTAEYRKRVCLALLHDFLSQQG
ncbi:MAG: FAD binding domain-containing protein [Burkholderiales bacterium]